MKRTRRLVLVLLAMAVVAALAAAAFQDTSPLPNDALSRKTDEINEAAAVTVPHGFDDGAVRRENRRLFEQVEQGAELTSDDSAQYRTIYQGIIFRKKSTLRRFDRHLTVIPDLEMTRPNNVGGLGVEGAHDHHDASMRANLQSVQAALQTIQDPASSTLSRVRSAVRAYKDTTDILTHLGTVPHTKSTAYHVQSASLTELEQQGEAMLQEFKQAQFAPVNSAPYWAALWRGLDRFDELILRVQTTVNRRLSPAEIRLAGRWDSAQSLGRWLTDGSTPRRYRPARR